MALKKHENLFGEITETSEMVQATLNFDWAKTELGPIENWDFGLINSLRIVFNCPVGMYCTWGPQRRVFYNDAYVPILQHRHPRALGSRLDEVWPEVWDQVLAIVSKVESGGTVLESDVQFDIEVKDGNTRGNYYTYGNSPLFNADGKISGMLCTILETTTSVLRTRAALQAAKDAAEHSNRAKSAFLANMSHEIRTPLGVILGFAELMGTEELEREEREKYLDVISRNGKSLTRIIDDILDLSKIEAGKFETEMAPVKIQNLLQEVVTMFIDPAAEKNIQLDYSLAEIKDLVVVTDAVRVRQVLINLIGNAIKFTSEGSVKISCKIEKRTQTRNKIFFTIQDTGIGMTAEQTERLFQPFTQADVTSTRRFGGTGLGLALSRNLAHALDGDVRIVHCEPEKGCIFEFSFQAEDANPVAVVPLPEAPTEEVQNSFAGFRVLAVDDSSDNRELIKTILNNSGLEVTEVESGEEALKQAFKQHYDIVLMDIQMPGLDGYGTLTELRKRGFQEPIIALTAHAMKEDKERTLAAGFADHLTKPINSKLLLQTIQSYLHHP
ncbi:response regulator [Bdellovibrio sp. HCB2-146]|uniref:response regulator n=1 Tax=Bdellovibrio sp. HCB2-146 TaxID=3394362 RepID=UPI0039BCAC53